MCMSSKLKLSEESNKLMKYMASKLKSSEGSNKLMTRVMLSAKKIGLCPSLELGLNRVGEAHPVQVHARDHDARTSQSLQHLRQPTIITRSRHDLYTLEHNRHDLHTLDHSHHNPHELNSNTSTPKNSTKATTPSSSNQLPTYNDSIFVSNSTYVSSCGW